MSFLASQVTIQNIFSPRRKIGDSITVDAIISEETTDNLTITKQPVQQGASITDHAFLEPTVLSMRILQQVFNPIEQIISTFSLSSVNSGLSQLYQEFLTLQADRSPFIVTTPKRIYKDMLIASLRLTTDKNTENILSLNITFQQILTVTVSTGQVSRSLQKIPGTTGATQPVGKKSFLASTKDGVSTLFGRLFP